MGTFKRIILFMIVNLLVMVTISIVTYAFGLNKWMSAYGINYGTLALFCLVWGMGGSFISLMLSKVMAKWMMGVQVIDPNTRDPGLRNLLERVHHLAKRAGIETMPEVGIYDSPEINAFATGPTKNSALVAVSSGLLETMNADEVDGVLGHEVAHIANGDMVTMTLIQGIVNAFVMFFARVIAFFVASFLRKDDEESFLGGYLLQSILTIVLEIAFSLLGMMVVAFFSRIREFRADAGGAKLAGKEKMIRALQALQRTYELANEEPNRAIASLKVSGKSGGLLAMFSTHPPLEVRIERLMRGE